MRYACPVRGALAILALALCLPGCDRGVVEIRLPRHLEPPPSLDATAHVASVRLRWTAPPYATGYRVYRGTAADAIDETPIEETAEHSTVVTGLTPGETVWFAVSTVGPDGNSVRSPAVSAAATDGVPLENTAVFSWESNSVSALTGFPLRSCECTGDGLDDLFVGSRGFDGGAIDGGRVDLFVGDAELGLFGPARTRVGTTAAGNFGHGLAAPGDVDGDSIPDLVAGGYGELSNEGRVTLIPGNPDRPATTISGQQVNALFGAAVFPVGDMDDDGFADVAVGGFGFDVTSPAFINDAGRVSIHRGTPAGLAQTPSWIAEGETVSAALGLHSGGTVGDLDGDGRADLAIGAFNDDGGRGKAYVHYSLAAGSFATEAGWSAVGLAADAAMGLHLDGGDWDNDGLSDLAVASIKDSGSGVLFLYRGRVGGLSTLPDGVLVGRQPGEQFGRGLSSGRDVNGDGYQDLVVAGPYFDETFVDRGRVEVHLGSAEGLGATAPWEMFGDRSNAQFGLGTAFLDANGDGLADLAVGAYGYQEGSVDEGAVFLYLARASIGPTVTAGVPQIAAPGDALVAPGTFSDVARKTYECSWTVDSVVQPAFACEPGDVAPTTLVAPTVEGDYTLRLRVTASDGRFGEAVTRVRVIASP